MNHTTTLNGQHLFESTPFPTMEISYQLMCDSLKCHFAEETKGSNPNTSVGVHDTHREGDWVRVFRFVPLYEQVHLTPHFHRDPGRLTLNVTSSGGRTHPGVQPGS